MEKKYYFRGLGLGIIVTAVIMGIALSGGGKKEKMTDDEVIARAKELGMIEDSTLLESSQEEAESEQDVSKAGAVEKEDTVKKDIAVAKQKEEADEKASQDQEEEQPVVGTPESLQEKENRAAEAEKTEGAGNPAKSDTAEAVSQKPGADTNEMTKQDEDIPKPETETAKSVTISSGDGSYTVARKLAEAGVVNSADSYDDFLCANGYDKRLRPGTFEIPAHASEEQIARIVTGQE